MRCRTIVCVCAEIGLPPDCGLNTHCFLGRFTPALGMSVLLSEVAIHQRLEHVLGLTQGFAEDDCMSRMVGHDSIEFALLLSRWSPDEKGTHVLLVDARLVHGVVADGQDLAPDVAYLKTRGAHFPER
jgi:hypothetical protein